MIFAHYIFGFIEDNAGLFVLPRFIRGLAGCTDFVGYPTGLCQNLLTSNQPLVFIPAFLLAKLVSPVLAYNIIVLGGLALNFLFALRFFKYLFGRFIALLLAVVFLASPYFAYQSRSHFDLIQFWPVIWFLHTLFFSKSRYKAIYMGLLLTLITGVSNYLGYFTVLFMAVYFFWTFILTGRKLATVKKHAPDLLKGVAVFALSAGIFMAPYIRSNFFAPKVRMENNTDDKAINRPFEDFVTFSSRPWYSLLPSVDNPFFGGTTQGILDRLANDNNYLTQNYFKAEHSASYLGWINLLLASVGLIGLARRLSTQLPSSPIKTSVLVLTIVSLIILTMPPSITLNGVALYTPSYLLFKFFPMFRVLSRSGVLILFLTLIFTGYGYKHLTNLALAKKISLKAIRSIFLVLTLIAIAEFFIPLKITHVATPPKVYGYLGQTDPFKSPIVVYPYTKTNEAFFWLTAHKKALINPRFYQNKPSGFVSEDFTNLLTTTRGLENARNLGAKYLVYFYGDDGGKSADFFENASLLTKVADFEESDRGEKQIIVKAIDPIKLTFVRIVEAGSAKENSAILYKFR